MSRSSTATIAATALLAVAIPYAASAQDEPPEFEEITRAEGTIVDVAASDPSFSTLVSALQATGLDETLAGPGPFTVFAPTDDAFEKVPSAVLDSLIADPDQLTQVLQYHVTQGVKDIRFYYDPRDLDTVQGQIVYADRELDELRVNNSNVGSVIRTDNGVIYVIDSVLLPQYR